MCVQPRVVKISGYVSLLWWLLVVAGAAILVYEGPSPQSSPTEAQFDRVATPGILALGAAGVAVSLGLLRAKVWPYHAFMVSAAVAAVLAGTVALFNVESWRTTVWSGGLCLMAAGLRRALAAPSVRSHFGLDTVQFRRPLTAPGWSAVAMGVATLLLSVWPVPTPMFGVWLQNWQTAVVNLVFAAGYVALGWGLLQAKPWTLKLTIAVAAAGLVYSFGLGWDPNPQGKLVGPGEAMNRSMVVKGALLGLALSGWTIRRIAIARRETKAS